MITYFNIIVLLILIKSTTIKNKAIKRYCGDDFLVFACYQYKSVPKQCIYTTAIDNTIFSTILQIHKKSNRADIDSI